MPETAVLSEQIQEHMKGRRLKAAVFLTFRFEPGFFEQEILPVFLDIALSHIPSIRLLQLEDALKNVNHIAVYYDSGGLEAVDQPAKIDFRRIPIHRNKGYFHPKNVFALVEDAEPDEDGNKEERLIVATMSANLTRAGWWENVDVCHIEEVTLSEKCSLRDDLLKLIRKVKEESLEGEEHAALDEIRKYLLKVEQRQH